MSVSTHFFLFQQQKSWPLPSPNTNTYKFNLFHHNHLSRSKNSFVLVFVIPLCRKFLFVQTSRGLKHTPSKQFPLYPHSIFPLSKVN